MRNRQFGWAELVLAFTIIFGALVRFVPTVLAHSVINDGGLFYTMMGEIRGNGFLLPLFTTYNHLSIPFAYPPLSLYLGALLSATGIPASSVIRWLPPLLSTLCIPAFYWMALQLLGARGTASLATLAYALMPSSFSWYVMGGGLSRALGILFLLLTCASAWRLFERPSVQRAAITAVFGAGAVMSHPETGLHTLAVGILIWLFRGRTRHGLRSALMVALGVLALSSPWWLTVILRHGLAPVLSALNTGGHSGLFWLPLVTFDFAEETFVTLFTALALIGLAMRCIQREWLLPVWILIAFVVEPRSASAIATLPLALLAGVALGDFVLPNLEKVALGAQADFGDWTSGMDRTAAMRIVLAYVMLSGLVGAFSHGLSLATYVVPDASQAALQWVKASTPPGSRFIVLTGRSEPFSDPTVEWFPTLTDRTSVNTIQGREWILGRKFTAFRTDLDVLASCPNAGPGCLTAWAARWMTGFEYVLLEKPGGKVGVASSLLEYRLRQDAGYRVAFENAAAVIFQHK